MTYIRIVFSIQPLFFYMVGFEDEHMGYIKLFSGLKTVRVSGSKTYSNNLLFEDVITECVNYHLHVKIIDMLE